MTAEIYSLKWAMVIRIPPAEEKGSEYFDGREKIQGKREEGTAAHPEGTSGAEAREDAGSRSVQAEELARRAGAATVRLRPHHSAAGRASAIRADGQSSPESSINTL